MDAGRVVEEGATADVIDSPEHSYTRGLINDTPRLFERRAGDPLAPAG